jgi:hypothetical protein
LGKKADSLVMRPGEEASLLATDARAFLKMRDPEQALPLAEAALSLLPNSEEIKSLVVDTSISVMNQCADKWEEYRENNPSKEVLDLYISTAIRVSPLIEETIGKGSAQGFMKPYPLPSPINEFLGAIINGLGQAQLKYSTIESQEKEKWKELTQIFFHLYRLSITKYPDHAVIYKSVIQNAFIVCDTTDQAVALSRDLLCNNSASSDCIRQLVSVFFRGPYAKWYAKWPEEQGATGKIVRYLEELAHHENPRMRLFAEAEIAGLYSQRLADYPESRKHCDLFIDLYKKQAPSDPTGLYPYYSDAIRGNLSADEREDRAIKIGYYLDILEYAFDNRLASKNAIYDGHLLDLILIITKHYISENKISEAAALYRRGIDEIKSEIAANELQRLLTYRPEIAGLLANDIKPIPTPAPVMENRKTSRYQSIQILSRKDFKDDVRFSRLVVNDRTQAIIYSDSFMRNLGIVHLTPETFAPRPSQFLSCSTEFYSAIAPGFAALSNGPEVAMDGKNFYLGSPSKGILISYPEGSCKSLNEKNGLASNIVQALEALDGKLFAVIGDGSHMSKDTGLMEVDLKSGISTILFSSKSKETTGGLNGKRIAGIASDPKRHALWILSPDEKNTFRLFIYYPEDQKLDLANSNLIDGSFQRYLFPEEPWWNLLRTFNDHLIIEAHHGSSIIDTKTAAETRLLDYTDASKPMPFSSRRFGRGPGKPPKWMVTTAEHSIVSAGPKPVMRQVVLNRDLIAINHSELMYFHDGGKDPEYFEQSLPVKKPVFRDIALTEKGLLVLTADALYLIPEIAEQKPDNKLSSPNQQ